MPVVISNVILVSSAMNFGEAGFIPLISGQGRTEAPVRTTARSKSQNIYSIANLQPAPINDRQRLRWWNQALIVSLTVIYWVSYPNFP